MSICNAPPGCEKNFRSALLVNFHSATHLCKNGNCTSVSGTPQVHFSGWSIFNPDYLLACIFPVLQIFLHLRCALLQFNFLSAFTSCE
jgi:hypothetical protein